MLYTSDNKLLRFDNKFRLCCCPAWSFNYWFENCVDTLGNPVDPPEIDYGGWTVITPEEDYDYAIKCLIEDSLGDGESPVWGACGLMTNGCVQLGIAQRTIKLLEVSDLGIYLKGMVETQNIGYDYSFVTVDEEYDWDEDYPPWTSDKVKALIYNDDQTGGFCSMQEKTDNQIVSDLSIGEHIIRCYISTRGVLFHDTMNTEFHFKVT